MSSFWVPLYSFKLDCGILEKFNNVKLLDSSNIILPVVFEGTCDTLVFKAYVEDFLLKELKSGQTVVMDNINFHKNSRVKELIESVGCSILFLPTYSPDLNPIEHYWFKIKNQIRKTAKDFEFFFDAVCFNLSIS